MQQPTPMTFGNMRANGLRSFKAWSQHKKYDAALCVPLFDIGICQGHNSIHEAERN